MMKVGIDFDIIKQWYEENKFTEEERELIKKVDSYEQTTKGVTEEWFDREITTPLFKFCPSSNITTDDYTVRFDLCATNIIKQLSTHFDQEDTLIVTSNNEHINVQNAFSDAKNLYVINADEVIHKFKTAELIAECKKWKNVFFYVIGTELSRGKIAPNPWFKHIRKELSGINLTICLDDVQGMYLVPRDYSLFDYVIGTAHSLITPFDLGICFQRKSGVMFGEMYYDTATEYLEVLSMFIKKRYAIESFSAMMQQAFSTYMAQEHTFTFTQSSPHIFSIGFGDSFGKVFFVESEVGVFERKYLMHIEGVRKDCKEHYIRFRGQEFLIHYNELVKGMKALEYIIKERATF